MRQQQIDAATARIRSLAGDFRPDVALILGSGLGGFADAVAAEHVISYAELPGFPTPGVGGHAGRLILGRVGPIRVAVLQGRAHYYEDGYPAAMAVPVAVLAELGCRSLLLTNAAGSLNADNGPGSVVAIADHINMTGVSPLFGCRGNSRFVAMTDAYDPALRTALHKAAEKEGIELPEGVYVWMSGPQFETEAEIRMLRTLGADLVGMSTVPEVILARHQGLRVAALSIVTNLAAGMSEVPLSHDQTLHYANLAADRVRALLLRFLEEYRG